MSNRCPDNICALCYHDKSEAHNCNRPDCECSGAAPCSSVSDEIIAFLLGEGPLDGVYFGEKHPFHEGRYWWRKHLRKNPTGQERVASADPDC